MKAVSVPLTGRQSIGKVAQPDQIQGLVDLLLDTLFAYFTEFERKGDIVEHVHMGPHRIGLKDHTDGTLFRGYFDPSGNVADRCTGDGNDS